MKKIILTILLYGVMFLGLTGCGTEKNEFDIGEKSNIEIVESGVSLSIKEGTLTKTGATLVLKNDTDGNVGYGNPWSMEIKEAGEWHKINVELNFTLPLYELKTKETKEFELNWENSHGALAPNQYRIIKSVDVEKEDGSSESFYVSAEFTIE